MLFDLPLEQLLTYKPERMEPSDFEAFWKRTLSESRQFPLDPQYTLVDNGVDTC